jgi:hypothetical protein
VKRASITLLFLCITVITASGADTISVNRGGLCVFCKSGQGYDFQFSAPGYRVTDLASEDFVGYSNWISGIPFAELYHDSFLFYAAPEGGLILNGQQFQFSGGLQFTATSFSYTFDEIGNLTVAGAASPAGSSITPCDPENCITVEGPTFLIAGQWRYVAHFARNQYQSGYYDFTDMRIFSPLRFIQ